MTQKELICGTETDSQDIEDRLVAAKGEGTQEGESRRLGLADANYHIYGMDRRRGPTVEQRGTVFNVLR